MGFLDKAKNLLAKNADKVDQAIDKAGDIVDKKTHGKYASTVDKVQDAAKQAAAKQAADGNPPPPQAPPAPPPPPAPPTPPVPPTPQP